MSHCDNCVRPWCYGCPYLEDEEEEEEEINDGKHCKNA